MVLDVSLKKLVMGSKDGQKEHEIPEKGQIKRIVARCFDYFLRSKLKNLLSFFAENFSKTVPHDHVIDL